MLKVSIITATYNSENSIIRCLDSVNSQQYPNIEHIIIDGASTDETLNLIHDNSPGSKVVSEPDNGIYNALNKGIELATGEVIGFLHSDDVFENENVISDIVRAFQENEVSGVYGDLKYVKENMQILRYWKSENFYPGLLHKGWMPPHPALFLKRKVYDHFGLFNEEFRISADYEFILRILLGVSASEFLYLPQPLVKMKTGGISNNSLQNVLRKSMEDLKALRINNIKNPLKVLFFKNISKLSQFFSS